MEQVTTYQCPTCTAPLKYSPETGKLDCEFCESSFTPREIEAIYREKEERAAAQWDTSHLSDDWGEDTASMRAYNCPACGAQLMCDQTTAATSCPYCGNPTVVPGQFAGALRPDYVIPFKLTKENALETLKGYFKNTFFIPKAFLEQYSLEKMQGVYVPFWLYDCKAVGQFNFKATTVSSCIDGNYRVTEVNHYDVVRNGHLNLEKVPADASSKMPDNYMDSIEPFDYNELQPFSNAYLPGFLADRYDKSAMDCSVRADERCLNTLEKMLRATVTGMSTCVVNQKDIHLERGKIHYAMLPVWMLNVKWNNKDYLYAINGQTGRVAGTRPVSTLKMLLYYLAITTAMFFPLFFIFGGLA